MLTIDIDDPTTTIVPVVPRVPPRRIAIAWHSGRRPSALLDAFVEATLAACADVAATWSSEVAARSSREGRLPDTALGSGGHARSRLHRCHRRPARQDRKSTRLNSSH